MHAGLSVEYTALLQAGHFVQPNVWNAALRAAVNAHASPAALDDMFEDMLLAGEVWR